MASAPPPPRGPDVQSTEEGNYEMGTLGDSARSTPPADKTKDTDTRTTLPERVSPKPWKIPIASPRVDVPLSSARDHLANERVFLAYFRTSSALATFAVVLLQLYRLKHDPPAPGVLSDYNIGIPLASTILVMAMLVTVFGAVRFFKCQNSMISSRIVGSGSVASMFAMVMIMVRC